MNRKLIFFLTGTLLLLFVIIMSGTKTTRELNNCLTTYHENYSTFSIKARNESWTQQEFCKNDIAPTLQVHSCMQHAGDSKIVSVKVITTLQKVFAPSSLFEPINTHNKLCTNFSDTQINVSDL